MVTQNPFIVSNFALEVQGVANAFFRSASGFDNNHEVIEHTMTDESGRKVTQKIPGELTWGDITLQRGITDSLDLWNWRQLVIDGKIEDARRDGSIVIYDQEGSEKARFNFTRGWPSAWKGPDVDASGNDVGIEEITITHEGLTRVL